MKNHFLTALFSLFTLFAFSQSQQTLKWQIGYHKSLNDNPTKWMPSVVPGAVQLDVMNAENYKQPYWFGNNFEQFTWMENYYFTYKTSFEKPVLKDGQRVYFYSKGIDYEFYIYLNGERIHAQEGMFTYVDIDITDKLKSENEIKIVLMPVPTVPGSRNTLAHYRDNARKSVKPAVSYGWDWHPRLITRGIWDDTYLAICNQSHLNSVWVKYELNDSLTKAVVKADIDGTNLNGLQYQWTIKNPRGERVLSKNGTLLENNKLSADLSDIKLWWPNGYGEANLYDSEIIVSNNNQILDKFKSKIGFRTIKMVMSKGSWDEPQIFPKGRSVSPATFEVNKKVIFAKGSNWVHPEIFMGLANRDTYEKQIVLAKNNNMNIFRVWGGGVTNKDSFFELCDQYGIMVWQEFPLACNLYPDETHYLNVLEQEATSIIKHVRNHASLALWCGGNELFNDWSMMTEQSLPLRLLNKLCLDLDPQTPFNYTSPLYGMAHGHYVMWEPKNGGEVFQWMPKSKNTAYTEFGVPSVANIDVLKK